MMGDKLGGGSPPGESRVIDDSFSPPASVTFGFLLSLTHKQHGADCFGRAAACQPRYPMARPLFALNPEVGSTAHQSSRSLTTSYNSRPDRASGRGGGGGAAPAMRVTPF